MSKEYQQFLATFFEEAEDHVHSMEAALLQLGEENSDPQLLNDVFRAAHSIKGAGSTLKLFDIVDFTHILETLLGRMRDSELPVTAESTQLLLESVDVLVGLLETERSGGEKPSNLSSTASRLEELNRRESCASSADTASNNLRKLRLDVYFEPSRESLKLGIDPMVFIRDLHMWGDMISLEVDHSKLPPIEEIDPESCYLAWNATIDTNSTQSDIEDVFLFADDNSVLKVCESQSTVDETEKSTTVSNRVGSSTNAMSMASSVRVNGTRLDGLINQIGELVIGVSMVEQEWASAHPGVESAAIGQLCKVVRDLQEQSLSLRMVPVAPTFQKMARIVRDLGGKLGKQVTFEVSGEETEIDKTVVDQIGDPLIHMVRNAVDHGIETPEERIAAGKPAAGQVKASAYHQGGNIFIELKDDGRGLNLDNILSEAVAKGVISPNDKITDAEICQLVFQPGLSTARSVTEVSGRGVGMDVVRQNIEAIKGTVSIDSQPGQGTTVTLRLPLTLAILDGLQVRLAEDVYLIPLLSVVESFRPGPNDVKKLANGCSEIVKVREDVIPVLRLHSLLDAPDAISEPCDGLLVVVEDGNSKYALLVDELLGQQQAVIKNLETNFRTIPGIAGATILGNGHVALILDILGLRTLYERSQQTAFCVSLGRDTQQGVRDSRSNNLDEGGPE